MSSLSVTAGIFFSVLVTRTRRDNPASFGRDIADPTGGSLGIYVRGRCLTKVIPPPSRARGHKRDYGVMRYKYIALLSRLHQTMSRDHEIFDSYAGERFCR